MTWILQEYERKALFASLFTTDSNDSKHCDLFFKSSLFTWKNEIWVSESSYIKNDKLLPIWKYYFFLMTTSISWNSYFSRTSIFLLENEGKSNTTGLRG